MKRVSIFFLIVVLSTLIVNTTAMGQLLVEDFSYTPATTLNGQGGWTAHSGAGTNPPHITSGSLSYPGYASSGIGNAVSFTTSGEDNNKSYATFPDGTSSGSLYCALMVRLDSVATTGDYFFHLLKTSTTFSARVFARRAANRNIRFGIGKSSTIGNINFSDSIYTLGTTYLLALKYTVIAGTTNDTVALWVNPTPGGVEPPPTVLQSTADRGTTDIDTLYGVALRQGTAANAAIGTLDGIRVGTTWESVVAATPPVYDDPAVMVAKAAPGVITVDGKMDEPEWATAKPYLKFGPTPPVTPDERSVTGGALVRGTYWDPSFATMKFLRKGLRLYVGIQSPDKSVGRFGDSWEGDGLFMKIKNAAGADNGEFHLYYNASDRTGASRDSAVYEIGGPFRPGFGNGIGLVNSGTIPYDTTQVDSGYTLELEIKLDSLGFAANVDTLQVLMNIFDPDGYHHGTLPWEGPDTRSYYKTWWGSEWGPEMRKIYLEPDRPYDDPAVMVAKAALGVITVDGKMDEPEWATAKPYLKFGPTPPVTPDERSVTGGALVRGTYWDPSFATMKFLRKGLRLYVGIQSPDKSVGRFGDSWEGDGLFMKIKNAAGADNGEFHLYYNASDRTGASRDSAVYEIGGPFRPGFGNGIGLVNSGTIPYDTTQVDSGYTLELEIKLDSLGFAANVDTLQVLMNIFDPDGYHHGTLPWEGPDTRSYYKTWWGSEWGPAMRKIYLEPQRPYDDPPKLVANLASGTITIDGNMNEAAWANARPYLKFGPTPSVTPDERSVTDGALVRGTYWDPSFATVKFLNDGAGKLYIGVQSRDKSVGRFGDSWEGDGLFMKIKTAAGADNGEFHLYYNASDRTGASRDSAVYEVGGPFRPGFGKGVGLVMPGTVAYDTTQVDSGYTLELQINLDSLGYAASVDSVQLMIDIFDPDGYHHGTLPWEGPDTRSYHKTWWGSEWGPAMRWLILGRTVAVATQEGLPKVFALEQNYPNPFNPTTTLQYALPKEAQVTLSIYNILGQRIATLEDKVENAGYHRALWNGRNDFGSQVASGVYFYRIEAKPTEGSDMFTSIKKMIVLK